MSRIVYREELRPRKMTKVQGRILRWLRQHGAADGYRTLALSLGVPDWQVLQAVATLISRGLVEVRQDGARRGMVQLVRSS